MTTQDGSGGRQELVSALLGRVHPGGVRAAWWGGEYRFRLDRFAAVFPEAADSGADAATLGKVFAHPVVGAIARSEAADGRDDWRPVRAALRVDAALDGGGVVAELGTGAPGRRVHLPGTGLVCDTGTGELRRLAVVDGLEVNNIDPSLSVWSDHVDTDLTFDWCTLVRAAQAFIAELGDPDFTDAISLTTVLVPLLQRDGAEFGRSSRFEIESGSVTSAVGAALISPGTGDAVNFAEAMVHESYHNLFNMALELDAFEQPNAAEFYAPWKGTTRPTRAVLHGIVAFSAIMRFWRQIGRTRTDWSKYADELVARRSEQVLGAASAVLSAGVLTDLGEEFAAAAVADAEALA
ncbi:aKG-HExxH-type peptide beta-hydroxylase [Nocardia jiangsuensis]|uniref:HEXXH motif-containing putative peptide modification protein n=1 Tax=Nocardia jiangsuensis TaxID=1691563 RepID=A0ABV8DU46_9NOCA